MRVKRREGDKGKGVKRVRGEKGRVTRGKG